MDIISLKNETENQQIKRKKGKNKISTTLYKGYNFLFLGLWNQLKEVTNIYFLIIAILPLFPFIQGVSFVLSFLPVVYVIFFAMIIDFIDDFKRYKKDK